LAATRARSPSRARSARAGPDALGGGERGSGADRLVAGIAFALAFAAIAEGALLGAVAGLVALFGGAGGEFIYFQF